MESDGAKTTPAAMDGRRPWRATFEEWILNPNRDHRLTQLPTVVIKGPFEIEVYASGLVTKKPRWKARLLPTEQPIKGVSHPLAKEAMNDVASRFQKRVTDWKEA